MAKKPEVELNRLEVAHVPAGPINTLEDVFTDAQVLARRMQIDIDGIPGVRSPITMSGSELALSRRSPRLGEHGEEIRAEISAKA